MLKYGYSTNFVNFTFPLGSSGILTTEKHHSMPLRLLGNAYLFTSKGNVSPTYVNENEGQP